MSCSKAAADHQLKLSVDIRDGGPVVSHLPSDFKKGQNLNFYTKKPHFQKLASKFFKCSNKTRCRPNNTHLGTLVFGLDLDIQRSESQFCHLLVERSYSRSTASLSLSVPIYKMGIP